MATIAKAKLKPKAKRILKGKPVLKCKSELKTKTALKEKSGQKNKPKSQGATILNSKDLQKIEKRMKSDRNKYLKELQESGLIYNRVPQENGVWQLQDAKARFSEVVKATKVQPQIITVHGVEAAVILSYDEFIELTTPKQSLAELIRNSPLYGVELDLPEYLQEDERDINL